MHMGCISWCISTAAKHRGRRSSNERHVGSCGSDRRAKVERVNYVLKGQSLMHRDMLIHLIIGPLSWRLPTMRSLLQYRQVLLLPRLRCRLPSYRTISCPLFHSYTTAATTGFAKKLKVLGLWQCKCTFFFLIPFTWIDFPFCFYVAWQPYSYFSFWRWLMKIEQIVCSSPSGRPWTTKLVVCTWVHIL